MTKHCTATMFTRFLRRNADPVVETPEGQLTLAICHQALVDADHDQREAMDFFMGRRLALVELIGLNPQFVREQLARIRPWALATKERKAA